MIREVHGGGRGTGVGQNVAGLGIVGAEFAEVCEPAVDVGNVIVVQQAANLLLFRPERDLAVFHIENVYAHLLHADDEIVGHGIPAIKVKGLTVIGHIGGQAVCPHS